MRSVSAAKVGLTVGVTACLCLTAGCGSSGTKSGSTATTVPSSGGTPTTAATKGGGSITIPFLGELSGPYSAVGQSALAGVQTAVHSINAAGGINGRKILIKAYDGQSSPTAEAAAIRQILGSNPPVMLTATVSSAFLPSLSSVAASKVPVVMVTPPLPNSTSLPFFTTNVSLYGGAAGPVAVLKDLDHGSIAGKTIAFEGLADSTINDAQLADAETLVKSLGGKVGPVFRDPIATTTWSSEAAKVVSSGAAAVLLSNAPPSVATIVKALGDAGYKDPIVADPNATSDTLLQSLNLKNFYVTRDAIAVEPGTALYKAVQAAGASITNAESQNYSAKGYEATYVAEETLAKCGIPCAGSKFAAALKSVGMITTPVPAFYGTLDYSSGSQSGVDFAEGWTWDSATSKAVPATAEIKFPSK